MGLAESVENFTNRELLEMMGEHLDALAKRVTALEAENKRACDVTEAPTDDPPEEIEAKASAEHEYLATEPKWWPPTEGCSGHWLAWSELHPTARRAWLALADAIKYEYRLELAKSGAYQKEFHQAIRAEAFREAADMVAEKLRGRHTVPEILVNLEESIRRLAEKDDK